MSEDVEIEEVEVIEEEKVSIVEKVKVHFEKNQQRYAYVAGVVTATITLSVIAAAARRPHYIVNYITIKMNPHMGFVGGRVQKIVRDEATGLLYESIADAATLTGVSETGIRKVVNGRQATAGGRTWTVVGVWSPFWNNAA